MNTSRFNATTQVKWICLILILGVIVGLFVAGRTGRAPSWTGFGEYVPPANPVVGYQPPKTLWDVLDLIIVPLFLGVIAFVFAESQRQNERKIADDRTRAATMQAYLDQMAKLLVQDGLGTSEVTPEVRSTARAYTMTTLLEVDGKRKGRLVQFLCEAGLIDAGERMPDTLSETWKEKAIVSLKKADLSHADLRGAFLAKPAGIDLICANLEEADLRDVVLSDAHLCEANLRKANLRGACLRGTDLRNAILCGADLRGASLRGADLRGADLRCCRRDGKTEFDLTRRDNTKGIERMKFPPDPLDQGGE